MSPSTDAVIGFYDTFAAEYELVYGGLWEAAIEQQAGSLDRLIHRLHPSVAPFVAADVLDCSCGIGTQAIGLALRCPTPRK